MTGPEALLVLLAGLGAGTINAVVGSGTLLTFPALLAVGYPPVVANVSNNVGLVGGGLSSVFGYRRELAGQRARIMRFGTASLLGGTAGAALLLVLPDSAFEAIVPAFIVAALILIVAQPRLAQRLEKRRRTPSASGPASWLAVLVTGVYGGYFGAAQDILLLAFLGIALPDDLQRVNALKNVLATLVNAVSAVVFVIAAHIAWLPVLLIAVGSTAGAQLGARYGRRLPENILRGVIVVVGLAAVANLLAR